MSDRSSDLDNPALYERLDPSNMRGLLRDLPSQCRLGWNAGVNAPLPDGYSGFESVIIAGMGGSAISGDIVAGLASNEGLAPITCCRDYSLPCAVDAKSLVIVCSYSGNTEESLSAFECALTALARMLVVTSGGRLKQEAERKGLPVVSISLRAPPRATAGYTLMSLLAVLQRVGVMPDRGAAAGRLYSFIETAILGVEEGVAAAHNPAKRLAAAIHGKMPVVYGAEFLAAVARRWKTQFNENSKVWAFCETLPELDHNSIVGYDFPSELKDRMFVVLLRSSLLHPRTVLRYRLTEEILQEKGIANWLIDASGDNALEQIMSALVLGDYVSYYLALLNGVDPTPVKTIDWLKQELR